MVMVHPTCGASLQKSTRVAAILEMATGLAFLLLNVHAMINVFPQALEERNKTTLEDPAKIHYMTAVLLSIDTVYWAMSLFMAVVLLVGANQRSLKKCRTWMVMTSIIATLFIVEFLMVVFSLSATAIQITSPVVAALLQMYMLWIVHDFMGELRLSC